MSLIALPMMMALLPGAWGLEVGDAAVSVTDDFKLRYYRDKTTLSDFPDNDHLFDYVEQVNRLNLLFTRGDTDIGLQVDEVWLFADRYYLDDALTYEHQLIGEGLLSPSPSSYVNAEKVWLTQRMGDVTVQVGDGYMSLGRGLALNLVKNTDIDIDSSVLGAQVSAALGDWDLDVASGLVNQQQVQLENPNVAMRADLRSAVHGAGVTRYGLGPANLGVHGAAYSFARETQGFFQSWSQYGEPVDAMVGGATVELLGVLGLDLFGEFDYYHHTCAADGATAEDGACASELFGGEAATAGRALYASATAYLGPVTMLAEFKDYINTERINTFASAEGYEFASGPTLEYERVITEDSSAAVNSNDITGGRVRADIAAVPGRVTPYVSVAAFRDRDLAGLHFNETLETIVHPVVGLDVFSEHINTLINAGYRVDKRDLYPPEGPDYPADYDFGRDRLAHADIDFRFPVGARFHGEAILDVQRFWWGENAIQQHDFTQGSLTLSLGSGGPLIYAVFLDYSNNPLISTTGNLDFFGEGKLNEFPPYAAAELVYKVNGSTTVKGFYGSYRAGIRCSGGQCRNLPGFDGARLSMSTTF